MSELQWNWVYRPYLDAPEKQKESAWSAGYAKVVFKSEADMVIAHHKYKRCLKMAELCRAKRDEIIARTPTLILNHPTEYLTRWENRWLELAEQFKEGV